MSESSNTPSMAQQAMSKSGLHSSRSEPIPHYTIQRDTIEGNAGKDNNVGHIYPDGSGKAINGGSILWALPRVSVSPGGQTLFKALGADRGEADV